MANADQYRMGYLTRVIRHGAIRSAESYRTGGRRTPGPISHGTAAGYAHRGCRCAPCVEANREYWREYAKRPKTWPAWAHGRRTTYAQGCRCDKCRAANARAHAEWKARRCPVKRTPTPVEKRDAERREYHKNRYLAIKAGTWKAAA